MQQRNRIIAPKSARFSEEKRHQLANLLVMAGFCVKCGDFKEKNKTVYYVEYWEESDNDGKV